MTDESLNIPRVVIACEHASLQFGGEAALPLHYFRALRELTDHVWLVTHARNAGELRSLFGDDERIILVEDSWWDRALWKAGEKLPHRIQYFTVGFAMRASTQLRQRQRLKDLIERHQIEVIHQPMPVSPKEPSTLFGFGVPVVIGPMNGGMDFPPAFRSHQGPVERTMMSLGRAGSDLLNRVLPGKLRADALLVANKRTKEALPQGASGRVVELVENGVELDLWEADASTQTDHRHLKLVFMGRLVDWKAVDILLEAFAKAAKKAPMSLTILGDGDERESLESQAKASQIHAEEEGEGAVYFAGWRKQRECAEVLRNSDALILPSLYECGGAVVLEAMAASKPVIATAWGGPTDYLDPSCGIMVEPTNRHELIDGLADAMIKLAADPELRRSMGAKGRQKVIDLYDWDKKVRTIVAIYRDAIANHV